LNVLLITYYFPSCGAIGSKRWGGFYNLSLQNKDIEFTVLTANWNGEKIENKKIHYLGNEIEYTPPVSINREYTFSDTLKHPTVAIRSVDRSLFASWKNSVTKWIDENRDLKFDIVIASFGPSACLLLGSYAKKVYKVPYILDLRDLVSMQGQKKKIPLLNFIDITLDRFLTKDVDKFLTVSSTCKTKAEKFYKKDVEVIYNGLDIKLEDIDTDISISDKENISILYTGTLGFTRNPNKIVNIIDEYIRQNPQVKVQIKFASQDNPFDFIKQKNLLVEIQWLGYLSKEEVSTQREKSSALLLLEDQTENGNENLTGKVFEYMASKKPIIVSCHENSDIIALIKDTNSGNLIDNITDFDSFIKTQRFLNVNKVNEYSRENQFLRLIEMLKNV